MTYNTKSILNMLSCTNLYDGKEFHEGNNEDVLIPIADFLPNFDYAHGATKLVIIPDKTDYVIKIPYTGFFEIEDGWEDTDGEYYEENEEYTPYEGAGDEGYPWDYCWNEVRRYEIAEEEGLEKYFAKTEFVGMVRGYPIYVQEKCTTYRNKKNYHSKEEQDTTSKVCGNWKDVNLNWLTDFRLYYGDKELLRFANFIRNNYYDDDLRDENIGYINDRPVLIDYSGFNS